MNENEKTKADQARKQSDHKCVCGHKATECRFPDCNADRTPKWVSSLLPALPAYLSSH